MRFRRNSLRRFRPTLRAICAEHGGTYHEVPMRSRGHVYPGGTITFAVFDKESDRHGAHE